MQVELLSYTPNPEEHIEYCARIAYASTDRLHTNPNFIKILIKKGHESVLEHASATFLIKDISRACSHQLVRHRLSSFTQQSQRYVKVLSGKDQALPLADTPAVHRVEAEEGVGACIAKSYELYTTLLARGVAPEDARYVLPQMTATTIVMTSNFRQWRNVLKLRLDHHAQEEIRIVAKGILTQLLEIAPSIFEDLSGLYP